MLRRTSAVLIVAFGVLAAVAHGQDLQAALTSQYHDKILALRHSFKSGIQEYASDGTPSKSDEEGSWTVYGRMVVDKVYVDAAQIRVEGKRATYSFDRKGNPVKFKEDRKHPAEALNLTLHLQQPLSSVSDAATVLGRVFALTPEDILHAVPEFWQPEVAKQLGVHELKKRDAQDAKPASETRGGEKKSSEHPGVIDPMQITPPIALYQPEPVYTDAARSWRLQGVVGLNIEVDTTGAVRKVSIVRPLGLGLDENAVATVSTWRFSPAKIDGKPVATGIRIDVDFKLF